MRKNVKIKSVQVFDLDVYEWHSNIDARVCWGHLMLVTADRGVGLKCDYQRDALATGIVRGR